MRSVGCLGLLVGCGLTEDRFLVEGVDTVCGAASDCATTFEPAVCVDLLRVSAEGCTYDRGAAKDCLDALEDAGCVQLEPFDAYALELPEACATAFDCGKRGWTDPLFEDSPSMDGG